MNVLAYGRLLNVIRKTRVVAVESVVALVVGAAVAGMIVGVVARSLWALAAPASTGFLYLVVVLPDILGATKRCDGWCSSQTCRTGFLRIIVVIYILAFGILPGMGGTAIGVGVRKKFDDLT